MENNNNSFIELVAKDGYLFMDKERANTFKRVLCIQSNVDEFIEVPEAEALQAVEDYEKSLLEEEDGMNIGGAE